MPWKAIACSEIGTSHKKSGKPCQDYVDFIRLNNAGETSDNGEIVIGAVSDGAGSCIHSDVGSELAVEIALQSLEQDNLLKQEQKLSQYKLKKLAQDAFTKTLTEVQKAFDEKAREKRCSPKDFSCTLLVVVTTPDWLAAMQIGDGFIVTRQPKSKKYKLLFHPSKGEYANETTFVTASNAQDKMQVKTLLGKQQFIFAGSDGLERIAINLRRDWQPHRPFFEMFENALKIRTENEEEHSTQEWLKSKAVNERTDDDKSILLFWYESYESRENPSSPQANKSVVVQSNGERGRGVKICSRSGEKLQILVSECEKYSPPHHHPTSPSPYHTPGFTKKPLPCRTTKKSNRDFEHFIDFICPITNVLLGVFCNSLCHDLFVEIKFKNYIFKWFIFFFIAAILAVSIFCVNFFIYKAHPYSRTPQKVQYSLYLLIIAFFGLTLGVILYYLIYQSFLSLSKL